MKHLQKAVEMIESSEGKILAEYSFMELRQLQAQQATAHALIALTQRVDQLIGSEISDHDRICTCLNDLYFKIYYPDFD